MKFATGCGGPSRIPIPIRIMNRRSSTLLFSCRTSCSNCLTSSSRLSDANLYTAAAATPDHAAHVIMYATPMRRSTRSARDDILKKDLLAFAAPPPVPPPCNFQRVVTHLVQPLTKIAHIPNNVKNCFRHRQDYLTWSSAAASVSLRFRGTMHVASTISRKPQVRQR